MLDYRIKTFITLYNEMNYRKTAEKLNMTQPGVTQHIHYIENYYGVKLFSYNGKTLSRTPNAEILKRHIDSILSEERETIREFSQKEKTVLNIGATKTIGEFVLVPVVRELLRADFAVVEGVFDKTKYPYHLYKKEHFVGICSKSHPFAGKTVSLKEVFRETLIVRESGSGTRRLLEQAVSKNGFSLDCFHRVISVSNFSVISDMVMKNNAITFAYEPVAKSKKDLAVFEVNDMQIKGEFNFVYCNSRIAKEKIDLLFC